MQVHKMPQKAIEVQRNRKRNALLTVLFAKRKTPTVRSERLFSSVFIKRNRLT